MSVDDVDVDLLLDELTDLQVREMIRHLINEQKITRRDVWEWIDSQ